MYSLFTLLVPANPFNVMVGTLRVYTLREGLFLLVAMRGDIPAMRIVLLFGGRA